MIKQFRTLLGACLLLSSVAAADGGPTTVPGHPIAIPTPKSLSRIDTAQKIVNLRVLLVGSQAVEFLSTLRGTTSRPGQPAMVSLTSPGQASYTYLEMRLGLIRGFQPVVHLYAVAERRAAGTAREFYPDVDGVVIAEREKLDAALLPLSVTSVPGVIYGPAELERSFGKVSSTAPLSVQAAAAENAMPLFKVLATAMLKALRTAPVK